MKRSSIIFSSGILGLILLTFSFTSWTKEPSKENDLAEIKFENDEFSFDQEEVWQYFNEQVEPHLTQFVTYEKKEVFSRCPSGLGQLFNQEESYAHMAIGEVIVWQGCNHQHFAWYKFDMKNKKTFLKKEESEAYSSLAVFIEKEKEKEKPKF